MENLGTGIFSILSLVFGLLLLLLAICWIILPFLLMSKLSQIQKELQELNKTQSYARQTALRTADNLDVMRKYYEPTQEQVS